jgi:hypothetical protein
MLSDPRSAVQPPWEEVRCYRGLWVEHELLYAQPDYGGLQDEIQASRRQCRGFMRHEAGWSPQEHRDLMVSARERRTRLLFLLLGAAITLVFTWIAKQLGLK